MTNPKALWGKIQRDIKEALKPTNPHIFDSWKRDLDHIRNTEFPLADSKKGGE